MRVLAVLAHQDDEMAMATRLLFHVKQGDEVVCVFLTDGAAKGASPRRRNDESLRVLESLGVRRANVHFLGTELKIADGGLVLLLRRALDAIEYQLSGAAIDIVYTLAWEGGHHDHDASHLVALLFALRRGIGGRCREMPLYHGRGTMGPFFRVLSPIGDEWLRRAIPVSDALRVCSLPRHYQTQRKSWAGLAPEFIFKTLVLRQERVRACDPSRVMRPPHAGVLFYERRFNFQRDDFFGAAGEILREISSLALL